MTAKNIKNKSIEGDKYYTPEWCVDQCLEHIIPVVCPNPTLILEPAAGEGVFVKKFRKAFSNSKIYALDIDENVGPWPDANKSFHRDYLDPSLKVNKHYDLTTGNPPYTYAMEFVKKALLNTKVLIFILRQGFLSSAKRNDFFRDSDTKPSYIWIVPDRPKFVRSKKQGDTADYCWVCWGGPNQGKETILNWLPSLPKNMRQK